MAGFSVVDAEASAPVVGTSVVAAEASAPVSGASVVAAGADMFVAGTDVLVAGTDVLVPIADELCSTSSVIITEAVVLVASSSEGVKGVTGEAATDDALIAASPVVVAFSTVLVDGAAAVRLLTGSCACINGIMNPTNIEQIYFTVQAPSGPCTL